MSYTPERWHIKTIRAINRPGQPILTALSQGKPGFMAQRLPTFQIAKQFLMLNNEPMQC